MSAEARIAAKKLTYEQAVDELEELVARMEEGNLPLEESLEAYRRGMELTRFCRGKLSRAEKEIKKLEADGELSPLKDSELRADSASRAPERPDAVSGASPAALDDDVPF
ncbi:exodeoxyribonuclease VII small subunit [Mesosutterella sp. OilRF-GAM-744-9]|uniref:Exodeoxyribonuclease 7 small subunit n=1 Tax=Mesosutterella porci TaxID=2915351 RepID=A0ABS9MP71_9BURK|nr:exodeoxyribonuclease VII small subunit [Mesosutterella sp. oilRF-744-WT-GAM-9]MCG5030414.1 exodeoxyribonuclease VII small subunit [Mesosutterella sp. oilRF-744-WT-GAM-9]